MHLRPFVCAAVLLALSVLPSGARAAGASAAPPAPPAGAPSGDDSDLAKEGTDEAKNPTDAGTGRTLQERIRAVSRRVFLKRQRFEVEPQFGFTTNDALNRAWSFGSRGSWHFNEEFALDFGGAYAPINQELNDIRVLGVQAGDGLKNVQIVQQYGYVDGGVTFSPFYGKFALMAEQAIHFDGFISAGLGAVFDNTTDLVHPAVEVGIGSRIFLSRWMTLRADLRNYAYPVKVGSILTFPSSLILTIGIGIHLPLDFDYSTEIIGAKG